MDSGSRVRWGLAGLFCLGVLVQWWPGYLERVVAPSEIRFVEGHAYSVAHRLSDSWFFRIQSDTPYVPASSDLVLFEDGRPIGAAHTARSLIATDGRGAFSHWGDVLYFSTTDNSDPRANGRQYSVRAALLPRRRLLAALAAVMFVALFRVIRSAGANLYAYLAASRMNDLLPDLAVVGLSVSALVVAFLGYSYLLDPLGTLELARKMAVKLAMAATWVAVGTVATLWFERRDLKSWRLSCALLALVATNCFLFLRAEAYSGNRLLPSGAIVIVPILIGVIGTLARRGTAIRSLPGGLWTAPVSDRRALTVTIVLVLCLAAPMIWSPVIQHWNASGWMDSHGYDTYAHNIISGKTPEGASAYMPVYQYGMAAVYYVFGHFFFAQQLINVLLSFLTVAFICLAAWNLFRNLWAVLLVGVWVAFARQLVYAVFFTQIESWYMPIVAFGIFAWTSYWRTPSKTHLVLVALAAGIGINTRNQGAFYFAWLCLAPLFIPILSWRKRSLHVAIAVAILAVSLIPWSVRNYVVDGRLSPTAARNSIYVGILNDPRIGFYGVRYWEGWGEISDDYVRRYPDPVERDRVMTRAGLSRPFTDFGWFQRAMFWRTLAFYGLLPPGVLAEAGPTSTNWATEWTGFVYWRTAPLMLLSLSLLGLITRPGRITLFLASAVAANVATTALTGGAEDRVSYPVLLLHMLMSLAAIFAPYPSQPGWSALKAVFGVARPRAWAVAALCLLTFLLVARTQFGRTNLYAPQVEDDVYVSPKVEVNEALLSLNDFASTSTPPPAPEPEWEGRSVRLRLMAFNYQCPPKFGGAIPYMPEFATDPATETYYYATLLVRHGDSVQHLPIAVAWRGATINERLREGDEVEAEGRLRLAKGNIVAPYWVHIEKARKVLVRSSEIPPFF